MSRVTDGWNICCVIVDDVSAESRASEADREAHRPILVGRLPLGEPLVTRLPEMWPEDLAWELRPVSLLEVGAVRCGVDFSSADDALRIVAFEASRPLDDPAFEPCLREEAPRFILIGPDGASPAIAGAPIGAHPPDRWPPIRGPPRPTSER